MNLFQNSDSGYKMIASKTFEHIHEQIKSSNLNFHIQLSPFSAQISLKKSLVKDRSGFPQTPAKASAFLSPQNENDIVAHTRKNLELGSQPESLKRDHEESALDCENAYTAVAKLEKALEEKGLHIEAIASEKDKLKEDLFQTNSTKKLMRIEKLSNLRKLQ